MRTARTLSTQILLGQIAVVLLTTVAGFLLSAYVISGELDRQYEQRALAVAHSVASLSAIHGELASGDPHRRIEALAEDVRHTTSVTYVVVTDRAGIRYSHPNADLIGKHVSTPPTAAVTGADWVGIQTGTLGRSARGKAPIVDEAGHVIGEASVGILEGKVSERLAHELPTVAVYMLAALGVGTLVAMTLARRLKRRTFGLELDEIAGLLQEREAMLHGIKDGVITLNTDDEVTLVNDEARRLLDIPTTALGRTLEDLLPEGRLRDVLTDSDAGHNADGDTVVLTDRYCLTIDRMPVRLNGRPLGAVITVHDRTRTEELLRELDSVRGFSDALRAQQHEFANRMHTLAGLLELREYEQAMDYLTEASGNATGLADRLRERIASPTLVAMLLAKSTVAQERGVSLVVTDESGMDHPPSRPSTLVTVVGNLVDNAIDAAAASAGEREVRLTITEDMAGSLTVTVHDTGDGLPEVPGAVFGDGYSTKPARAGIRRGLGLALVWRLVRGLDGTISATNDSGALFTVSLPPRAEPTPTDAPTEEEVRL